MVNVKTVYIAEDGSEFDTIAAAEAHDKKIAVRSATRYEKYIHNTYAGQELLKAHSLTEYGTWRVHGEDPNADLSGPHHEPYIGTYEGTLEQVIRHAVDMPGFWQWGSGGSIKQVTIHKLV